VLRGYASRSTTLTRDLDGVRVTAYAPRSEREVLDQVLEETVVAVETLSESLAPYPWRELDVVSAPLGAGVGGMEWPGATWIEPDLFAGGLPGLGGLADSLGGLDGLGGLLGGEGGVDGLGSLLGGGETGLVLDTLRAWTIAHEVGHEWWHVVVGNDSVLDPVVDEPLAQHSACLVMRRTHPADADALCSGHVDSAYEQMRLLGDEDAAAARPTDAFASSGQYAGVVYGKAAAFYRTLEDEFGREQVTAALSDVVRDHAFEMLDADQLRDSLARSLEGGERFDRLWTRWMERRHGDADLGVDADAGLGGLLGQGTLDELLGGGGQDAQRLTDLLGELLGGLETGGKG
jgi:aminopeptidase N